MDEKQKAIEFTLRLDEMLQTGSVADPQITELDHLLNTAHKLSMADFSSQSSIRQSLYARLSNSARPKAQPSLSTAQRKMAAFAFSILILLAVSFTFPPVRTLAQEIIKRLQSLTLTNAPSLFEPYLTATPTLDPQNPPFTPLNLSLDQAIAKAGFTPLVPTYLPAGYTLTHRDANVGQINSEFEPAGVDPSKCCVIFAIRQLQLAEKNYASQYPVGDVPILDVTVRGKHGLWVQNAQIGMTPDANGKMQIMPANLLTWEEDNFLFWLTSYDALTNTPLSQEEMMRVANALQIP